MKSVSSVQESTGNKFLEGSAEFQGSFHVIFQKRLRVFHRGFKHEKTDESTRPSAFIDFECLKP